MAHQFDFSLKGIDYRAEVPDALDCYILRRKDSTGFYEKVPCMTDAEERKFPIAAGYVATAYLHGLQHK